MCSDAIRCPWRCCRSPPRTDQDAYIYDLAFGAIADPDAIARRLEAIPGIIGHGLFLGLVDAAYVADGENVRVLERPMPSNRR